MVQKSKGKRLPSQEKYDQKNPTITIRMSLEEKALLVQQADQRGMSQNQVVKEAIGLVAARKEELEEEHVDGYSNGYEDAEEEFRIDNPCPVCGEPMRVHPNGDFHEFLINAGKEAGWAHQGCHEG